MPRNLPSRLFHICALVAAITLIGTGLVLGSPASGAVTGQSMAGYAWSDTIGWISADGPGYGLAIAADGTVSGYAWSDNIGWVSAQAANLAGCPSAPCTAKLTGTKLEGWFKALAADTRQSGGWDGWISLAGLNYGPTLDAAGTKFSGFAWGSMVTGWVDISAVRIVAGCSNGLDQGAYPSCTCPVGQTQSGSTCVPTTSCDQGFTLQNGVCVFTGCPSGYTEQNGACVFTGCPLGFTLQNGACVFTGCPLGYTEQNGQCVFIACPAGYLFQNGACVQQCPSVCSGSNLVSCDGTLLQQCSFGCSSGSCLAAPPAPSITTWTVSPTLVRIGTPVRVTWTTTNAVSCTVSGTNGDSWTGTSGDQTTSPIAAQTTYTIVCQGLAGSSPSSVTLTSTVNILPGYQER